MRRRALVLAVTGLALAPGTAGAIVGGAPAAPGELPSVANVGIGLPGAPLFGCTGTLIDPQWVLTAGHCSSLTGGAGVATPAAYPPQSFTVTVGGVRADGSDGEAVRVDDVQIPSDYQLGEGYDVSLLHLAAPARTAPTPVAGRGYGALFAPGVLEEIAGFGLTSEGGDAPDVLHKARVPVIGDPSCAAAYGTFEAATQLCAGYPQGGTDTCQGDSGGPLFGRTDAGRRLVVGSTSYGDGCARPGKPGVYARVADEVLREGFIRRAAPGGVADAPVGGSAPSSGGGSGSGGTAGSGSSPAAAAAFRASLAVDRTRRSTLRARGLRVRLRCSAACAAGVRLRVDAATARKLRLASRTVGTTSVRRTAAGRTTTTVRISRRVSRRLAARRGARYSVVATVTSASGRSAVLSRRAALTGR